MIKGYFVILLEHFAWRI